MPTYKVKFLPSNVVVEVDPVRYPYGNEGVAGSVLDVALSHGVHVNHACGGAGVCGTCQVHVEAGMDNLSPAGDDELDTVEQQIGYNEKSRLACQAVVQGDVTVRVPD